MASELRVNTLKDASGNNSIATSFVAGGSAKMWSNVQSDQSTQNDSLNVSSTSDEGTGASRRNLASAFANNPFSHAGLSVVQPNSAGLSKFTSVSASAVETSVRNTSNSAHDKENSCIAIGDLA